MWTMQKAEGHKAEGRITEKRITEKRIIGGLSGCVKGGWGA